MQAEKHSLTSNISAHIFCFLRRLCHGWLLCKHSTDRGQTKSFQSIPWNPVAPACFRGERCSLTCQSVCTQTATVSKGAEFSILSQSFLRARGDEIHWRSLKVSTTNTKQEGHADAAPCVCERVSWRKRQKARDFLRKSKAAYWDRQSQRGEEVRG